MKLREGMWAASLLLLSPALVSAQSCSKEGAYRCVIDAKGQSIIETCGAAGGNPTWKLLAVCGPTADCCQPGPLPDTAYCVCDANQPLPPSSNVSPSLKPSSAVVSASSTPASLSSTAMVGPPITTIAETETSTAFTPSQPPSSSFAAAPSSRLSTSVPDPASSSSVNLPSTATTGQSDTASWETETVIAPPPSGSSSVAAGPSSAMPISSSGSAIDLSSTAPVRPPTTASIGPSETTVSQTDGLVVGPPSSSPTSTSAGTTFSSSVSSGLGASSSVVTSAGSRSTPPVNTVSTASEDVPSSGSIPIVVPVPVPTQSLPTPSSPSEINTPPMDSSSGFRASTGPPALSTSSSASPMTSGSLTSQTSQPAGTFSSVSASSPRSNTQTVVTPSGTSVDSGSQSSTAMVIPPTTATPSPTDDRTSTGASSRTQSGLPSSSGNNVQPTTESAPVSASSAISTPPMSPSSSMPTGASSVSDTTEMLESRSTSPGTSTSNQPSTNMGSSSTTAIPVSQSGPSNSVDTPTPSLSTSPVSSRSSPISETSSGDLPTTSSSLGSGSVPPSSIVSTPPSNSQTDTLSASGIPSSGLPQSSQVASTPLSSSTGTPPATDDSLTESTPIPEATIPSSVPPTITSATPTTSDEPSTETMLEEILLPFWPKITSYIDNPEPPQVTDVIDGLEEIIPRITGLLNLLPKPTEEPEPCPISGLKRRSLKDPEALQDHVEKRFLNGLFKSLWSLVNCTWKLSVHIKDVIGPPGRTQLDDVKILVELLKKWNDAFKGQGPTDGPIPTPTPGPGSTPKPGTTPKPTASGTGTASPSVTGSPTATATASEEDEGCSRRVASTCTVVCKADVTTTVDGPMRRADEDCATSCGRPVTSCGAMDVVTTTTKTSTSTCSLVTASDCDIRCMATATTTIEGRLARAATDHCTTTCSRLTTACGTATGVTSGSTTTSTTTTYEKCAKTCEGNACGGARPTATATSTPSSCSFGLLDFDEDVDDGDNAPAPAPTPKRRAIGPRQTPPPSPSGLGMRTFAKPGDQKDGHLGWLKEQFSKMPKGNILTKSFDEKYDMSVLTASLDKSAAWGLRGVSGCTSVIVISRNRLWMAHIWESPTMESTADEFKTKVIEVLTKGDSLGRPSLSQYAGRGKDFENVPENHLRAIIISPYAWKPNGKNEDSDPLRNSERVDMLADALKDILGLYGLHTIKYTPKRKEVSDSDITNVWGKVLIQYEPRLIHVPQCKESLAGIELWFEEGPGVTDTKDPKPHYRDAWMKTDGKQAGFAGAGDGNLAGMAQVDNGTLMADDDFFGLAKRQQATSCSLSSMSSSQASNIRTTFDVTTADFPTSSKAPALTTEPTPPPPKPNRALLIMLTTKYIEKGAQWLFYDTFVGKQVDPCKWAPLTTAGLVTEKDAIKRPPWPQVSEAFFKIAGRDCEYSALGNNAGSLVCDGVKSTTCFADAEKDKQDAVVTCSRTLYQAGRVVKFERKHHRTIVCEFFIEGTKDHPVDVIPWRPLDPLDRELPE